MTIPLLAALRDQLGSRYTIESPELPALRAALHTLDANVRALESRAGGDGESGAP